MLKANLHQVQMAEHTCRKSLDSLSCLCSNFAAFSQPLEQPLPSPLGRLTCVLSALPTSPWSKRPRNRLHLPCTLRRLQYGWCLFLRCVQACRFRGIFFWKFQFATFFLVCWQKGDRPDNDLRWAMQHPDKKKSLIPIPAGSLLQFWVSCIWLVNWITTAGGRAWDNWFCCRVGLLWIWQVWVRLVPL